MAAGARGRLYNPSVAKVQGLAARLHAALFRASGGRFGGRLVGSPVLLLNTRGRKSGKPRTTPLLYLEDGGSYAVVASNGGTVSHPAWLFNLRSDPEATVEIGDRKVRVRAEEAEPGEKERLWGRLVEMYAPYAQYQNKTDREIPVVVLHPSDD
jgi:F420H(2)-dependent quinone reductase